MKVLAGLVLFEGCECNHRTSSKWSYCVPNKMLSCFSETHTKTSSHTAEACTEEITLTSSCTQNQSLAVPSPREPKDWDINGTWTPEPFRSEGSTVQEDLALKLLTISYHKWPSSEFLQLKLALTVLLHSCSFNPLKACPKPWMRERFRFLSRDLLIWLPLETNVRCAYLILD